MKLKRGFFVDKLNQFSLKKKMMLIQLFCVVLPLLLTDSAIIGIIVNAERQSDMQEMSNIADSVNYTITSVCEAGLKRVQEIYIDQDINNFIKEEFSSPLDFYNQRIALEKSIGNGKAAAVIYTNALGTVNGGNFQQLENIKQESWYRDFENSGNDVMLVADFLKVSWETRRTLFFVRRMDFYNKKTEQSLLRLDLDYSDLLRRITNAKYSSVVYVCKDDKILLSNEGKGGLYNDFETLTDEIRYRASVRKNMKMYGEDWWIYVMPGKNIVFMAIQRNVPVLLMLVLLNIILPSVVTSLINRSFTERLYALKEALQKVERDGLYTLPQVSGADEISELMQTYNEMTVRLNKLIEIEYKNRLTKQESDIARQRAELLALHSQINPHFLFNALESIRMHSVIKNENETARMIERLALMQRQNVEWGNDLVSIRDEMRFGEAYLELQKYRFGNKLNYEINIDEDCMDHRLPKLSLVTFVENACVHGMENKTSACWVFVRIAKDFENLVLEVEDTGSGMNEELCRQINEEINHVEIGMLQSDNRRIGILNAALRLKMFYERVHFELESESGAGTMVTITIPLDSLNLQKTEAGVE